MLEQFPPEIVSNIVSSFDRFDFMQCAQVNRSWRQHLPPYSAHLWEQIHIKGDHHLVFLADTTCFGQYIKSCTITMLNDDAMVFLALERLQGRHLQSLGKLYTLLDAVLDLVIHDDDSIRPFQG